MANVLPIVALDGWNPVIVGAPAATPTVKFDALVADPAGVETVIGPVVAPEGTVVEICVLVAEMTVAATPLNSTVSCEDVVLKPVPLMTTEVPTGPVRGVNETIETWLDEYREIESMFPTASY